MIDLKECDRIIAFNFSMLFKAIDIEKIYNSYNYKEHNSMCFHYDEGSKLFNVESFINQPYFNN